SRASMETLNESLDHELQQLRERLEEAEDVRRAITRGEVDAFVVGPDGTSRVLLLANAYQRYRQVVERMQQGAVTASGDGKILFANQRFSDMLDVPLAQLYTAPLETYVRMGDRARVSSFLMISARDSHIDVELVRRDGTTIPVRLSLASFADGYATILVTDMRPIAQHQRADQRPRAHDRRDARRRGRRRGVEALVDPGRRARRR
ncbi:MAG: sensor signal transduction histidine kinase, partial [Burkholderiales bacterium]|nr:sensor signal transduction histidine kinase [Burkholderiales bacterium]